MAHVNASRPQTVRTAANEGAIITAVEREAWRSSRNVPSGLELSQSGDSKYFMTINRSRNPPHGAQICFQKIVLCRCKFTNCSINTLHNVESRVMSYARGSVQHAKQSPLGTG
jgi:hypothetical protein